MNIEQGDLILCTVDRIIGTNVFVKIDKTEKEGTITLSEIAPGRIRNLRDYVVPKKKIVCKVLKADREQIVLSLRRVSQKEEKEVKEKFNIENSYKNILKTILKEKFEDSIKKIEDKEELYDFLEEAKKESKILEKIVGKENSKKILEILNNQKKKKIFLKKEINLSSEEPNGIALIKEILNKIKNAEIKYLCAGKYSINIEDTDMKNAGLKIKEIISEIEQEAKKKNLKFEAEEKKWNYENARNV